MAFIVTEHGIADLKGKTIRQRAEALIAIAAPQFRDQLRKNSLELYGLRGPTIQVSVQVTATSAGVP